MLWFLLLRNLMHRKSIHTDMPAYVAFITLRFYSKDLKASQLNAIALISYECASLVVRLDGLKNFEHRDSIM